MRVSKLLALKRPLLIPIYDSKIAEVFGRSTFKEHWSDMRDLFKSYESLRDELAKINTILELNIPVIRTLDVILWMYGRGNRAMRADGGLYILTKLAK